MSLFDEQAFRTLVADEVRRVVREEMERLPAKAEYISVADAAQVAQVAPGTIRAWIASERLPGYRAGRELRVKRNELDHLLAEGGGGTEHGTGREPTPEEEADRFMHQRQQRRDGSGR